MGKLLNEKLGADELKKFKSFKNLLGLNDFVSLL
jgi:hypothetical protein